MVLEVRTEQQTQAGFLGAFTAVKNSLFAFML